MKALIVLVATLVVLSTTAVAAPILIANKSLASEKIEPSTLKSVLLGKKVSSHNSVFREKEREQFLYHNTTIN